MEKIVVSMTDKTIDYYMKKLKDCFYVNDDVAEARVEALYEDKPFLIAKLDEMENFRSDWGKLLGEMKNISHCRIRDMSDFGQRHSYKAVLAFPDGRSGFVMALNIPFKLYGLYFCELIPSAGTSKYIQRQSYTPFDQRGMEAIKEIEKMVRRTFDGFEAFDNKYASAKIATIVIDGLAYKELDLWQAFFTTNMFGIM